MTNTHYRTGHDTADSSTFGGRLYKGDFDTCHYMSDIAARILADWRFDEECRKNAAYRAVRKDAELSFHDDRDNDSKKGRIV